MKVSRTCITAALSTSVLLVWGAPMAGTALGHRGSRSPHAPSPKSAPGFEARSLDGAGNNRAHPEWGEAGMPYVRVAPPHYADGIAAMVPGPPPRYISNRIFNDTGQNIFSRSDVSQWGWLWSQFLDHTFGLRDERPGESAPIPFDATDPLERFRDDLGRIDFLRTAAAPGTGVTTPRQQINTVHSYIDGYPLYGGTTDRLGWLRDGATLFMPGGYLPRANARGNALSAPRMEPFGAQVADPTRVVIAGDVRANENMGLTGVQTLFAREHNRIVSQLPSALSAEEKFQIARRVVGAEEQYITYTQFLPAMGVRLSPYRGYDPSVDSAISNEFATVGFRGHSMIHGEMEPAAPDGTYSAKQLAAFEAEGIDVAHQDGETTLTIPLNLTFGNPDLLQSVGLGPLLKGLGNERQYGNDEQIDESLRSVLFQVPKPGTTDPSACAEPVVNASCYSVVEDLGAIDVQRGRDHGMPSYNDLRKAYGLAPKRSYEAITGESSELFPKGRRGTSSNPLDDPSSLDFTKLEDDAGQEIEPGTDAAQTSVTQATRRTTLAARLRGVYGAGNVDKVDAFVGMVSEQHVPGTEFGELQLAMWKRQFEALRDGDRFFYLDDPALDEIRRAYGIDYRHTLAQLLRMDADVTVQPDIFKTPEEAPGG